MIRGSTPDYILTLNGYDLTDKRVYVTIGQRGKRLTLTNEDVEISVDDMLPLIKAHHIAETTHAAIEANFPLVKHCMVHVNPMSESDHASTIELPEELQPKK